ncbi:MAG TPA: 5'/3'-nucleotidase SurE [Allosphingosinicella sp.]|jgi:5'-nucleotidase
MIGKALFRIAVAASLAAGGAASGPARAADSKPCRLLLVNDDGIDAPGIHALYQALKDDCELVVSAPAVNQSGMSHAIPNLSRGLKVRTVPFEGGSGFAVEGSPAEAAGLGVMMLGGDRKFDLVVSGINAGENTGLSNLYSGTVNAGMEAMVRGTPAIAFSQGDELKGDFSTTKPLVRAIVRRALSHPLPRGVMLNVNIPKDFKRIVVAPSRGMSVILSFTAVPGDGVTTYVPKVVPNLSPPPGGDVAYYEAGDVTVTPLELDRTAKSDLAHFRRWIRGIRR